MKEHAEGAKPARRILVDCDGVLADFNGAVCKHFDKPLSSVTDWDYAKAWGYEPKEFWGVQMAFTREPGFWLALDPMRNVGVAMAMLRELGEVIVVTSPMKGATTWCHERLLWLSTYAGVARNEVVITGRKDLVKGDVLIDDGPHNLADVAPHMMTIAIDTPYNQGVSVTYRVTNIIEAAEALRELWK